MNNVTIIGLGMVGASIGLALRNSKAAPKQVIGFDIAQDVQRSAKKVGAIDVTEWSLADAVNGANLIVIATPVAQAYDTLHLLSKHANRAAIITDTLPVNGPVTEWAQDVLTNPQRFLTGNPLAGNGISGQENATADLFTNRRWALSPSADASGDTIATVQAMIEAVGASTLFLDADEHDSFSAAISSLPSIMATALLNIITSSESWPEMHRFLNLKFDSGTRAASENPALTTGAAALNINFLEYWIDALTDELQHLKHAIADYENSFNPDGKWVTAYVKAWEAKASIDAGVNPRQERLAQKVTLPSSSESMGQLFVGEQIYKRWVEFNKSRQKNPLKYDRNLLH